MPVVMILAFADIIEGKPATCPTFVGDIRNYKCIKDALTIIASTLLSVMSKSSKLLYPFQ